MISNFEDGEVEEIPALVNGKKRKSGASGDEATPATKKQKNIYMRPQPILQIIPPLTDDENVFDREQPRGITRRAILERKNALHDGIQRAFYTMCRNGNFGLVFARGQILLTYMFFAYHWTS